MLCPKIVVIPLRCIYSSNSSAVDLLAGAAGSLRDTEIEVAVFITSPVSISPRN